MAFMFLETNPYLFHCRNEVEMGTTNYAIDVQSKGGSLLGAPHGNCHPLDMVAPPPMVETW